MRNFVLMKPLFRRITGIFFLLTFLSPFVEKQLHDFVHSKDFHCEETAGQHLHSYEHVCSFCDYHFQTAGDQQQAVQSITPFENSVELQLPFTEAVPSSFFHCFSSRGPPALS